MKSKILSFVAAVLAATLVACGTLNPLSHAQTVEQKAYALYGEFVVVEEQEAQAVNSPQVSASIKQQVLAIDTRAKSAADSLLDAAKAVRDIRDQIAKGTSTDQQLVIATASLQKWYDDLSPKLAALAAAVKGTPK
jgi:hypothetical protein